jgi:hypothetical protein
MMYFNIYYEYGMMLCINNQLKGSVLGAFFGSREPREPHPSSLFELITLITYLFSLLLITLRLSCLPLSQPVP